jgi:hypothetical protein
MGLWLRTRCLRCASMLFAIFFGWNLLLAIFIFIFAPQALMADGFWLFLRGGDDNRYLVDTDS